jgi:hypothetical protein
VSDAIAVLSAEERDALVAAGLLSVEAAPVEADDFLVPHTWSIPDVPMWRRCACGAWVSLATCAPCDCGRCGRSVRRP